MDGKLRSWPMPALSILIGISALPVSALTEAFDFQSIERDQEAAIFAGGCFWSVEAAFEPVNGVIQAISGYTGGTWEQPTERQVLYADTGHQEAVLVLYDPGVVTYTDLLTVYWRNIDPEDAAGQFCDRGTQYTSAIFTLTREQRRLALASREALQRAAAGPEAVATEIRPATAFWVAEDHHQDYYRKQPFSYQYYLERSGRVERLQELWTAFEDRDENPLPLGLMVEGGLPEDSDRSSGPAPASR